MEHVSIARVALAAATYAIDRPYDYQIPQELEGRAAPGDGSLSLLERETAAQRD